MGRQRKKNGGKSKRTVPARHKNSADPHDPVPDGTRGTVKFVDDMGTVFPDWDNGRGLGVVYGEDSFRKLTPEELLEEQQKEDINQDTDMGMNMGM